MCCTAGDLVYAVHKTSSFMKINYKIRISLINITLRAIFKWKLRQPLEKLPKIKIFMSRVKNYAVKSDWLILTKQIQAVYLGNSVKTSSR